MRLVNLVFSDHDFLIKLDESFNEPVYLIDIETQHPLGLLWSEVPERTAAIKNGFVKIK